MNKSVIQVLPKLYKFDNFINIGLSRFDFYLISSGFVACYDELLVCKYPLEDVAVRVLSG